MASETGETPEDRIAALEAECAEANSLIGFLRYGCLKHRDDYGEATFLPYQRYLATRKAARNGGDTP